MNKRRKLVVTAAALTALAWANSVRAQATSPVLIGWLDSGTRDSDLQLLDAFKEGMAAYGWKEGVQYAIEERWLDGRMDQLPRLAQELAARKPRIILAQPSSLVVAASKAAPGIPIVQMGGSPVESGTVTSFARPGGMITGVSSLALTLSEKLVELFREAMPKARRAGFLGDPKAVVNAEAHERSQRATKRFLLDARFAEASTPDELEPAIGRLAKEGAQGIVVLPNLWFTGARHRIVKSAMSHHLPVFAASRGFTEIGALLAYGADTLSLRRRSAYYVDRILKGAKPADLPVEQPTKFDLTINLKTAKALGIKIPNSILVRADKVIE